MALLKMQAEGKIPGPVPVKVLQRQLKLLQTQPRPKFQVHRDVGIGMWVANTNYGYILGQSKNGKRNHIAINAENNGCYYPITLQVDSSQNLWSSCEYNSEFSGTAVQEYDSTGTLENTYNGGCPSPISECDYWYAYGFSAATNSSYVFSAQTFTEEEICNPSCEYYYGSGFEYWPLGDPSATPAFVNVGENCDPVCDTYYMDVDNSNNIYFTYYGYSNGEYGYGLAEVENATSPSWTMVSLLAPGTLGFAGGVYISNGGSVLNVTDQMARTTTQYALPWTGTPIQTLGPTKENAFSCGDPVTGAFNNGDTKAVFGDACGWIDKGTVPTNKWKTLAGINFNGAEGAAYSPSDR